MLTALLLLAAAPQSDALPPARPLPYGDPEIAGVMTPIEALFAALSARDGAAILAQVNPRGLATVADERPDGTRSVRHMSWAEFAGGVKPGLDRIAERLDNPAVEIDGDIAMVWSPYVFTVNGRVQHCGTDHFDLVRDAGRWRVLNVTWTSRTDCVS